MSTGQILEMDLEIEGTLLLLQRRIFNDKGLWYLTEQDFNMPGFRSFGDFYNENKKKREEKKSHENPVGLLVVIEDVFILRFLGLSDDSIRR